MQEDAKPPPAKSLETTTHFVVEIVAGDATHYAVCERILLVGPGTDTGLTPQILNGLFGARPLRALPLPTSGEHGLGAFGGLLARGQSSRGALVSVTINNNSGSDDNIH
ncbi:hypothetical protein ACFOKI_16420 [Sphingomonas qilianensis]|uniref:Uncharacterized protein n=1 Tax=Sphingomonas qilianensis TaxID=1736690 RepID=A0ABU9XWM4_9SPHN